TNVAGFMAWTSHAPKGICPSHAVVGAEISSGSSSAAESDSCSRFIAWSSEYLSWGYPPDRYWHWCCVTSKSAHHVSNDAARGLAEYSQQSLPQYCNHRARAPASESGRKPVWSYRLPQSAVFRHT